MRPDPLDVTGLLNVPVQQESPGLPGLEERMVQELRSLAARELLGERPDHTLQPTALVNEAWLRLAAIDRGHWQSRSHFLAAASVVMRHVLVDSGRRKRAVKRNYGARPAEWTEAERLAVRTPWFDAGILDLHEALDRLEQLDPKLARVVECRFFGGMTDEETAEVLGVSSRTVKRYWSLAKTWLHAELRSALSPPSDHSGSRE